MPRMFLCFPLLISFAVFFSGCSFPPFLHFIQKGGTGTSPHPVNEYRDVAQSGRVLVWGASGRGFKSRHPDNAKSPPFFQRAFFFISALFQLLTFVDTYSPIGRVPILNFSEGLPARRKPTPILRKNRGENFSNLLNLLALSFSRFCNTSF